MGDDRGPATGGAHSGQRSARGHTARSLELAAAVVALAVALWALPAGSADADGRAAATIRNGATRPLAAPSPLPTMSATATAVAQFVPGATIP